MTLDEYITLAKEELDQFRGEWLHEHEKNPGFWPLELSEKEWGEQELSGRFGGNYELG